MPKKKRKVNKSAVTGKFVTKKEAKSNPRETVCQTVKSKS